MWTPDPATIITADDKAARALADLITHAANKRYAIETGGVTINGAKIDTSRDSQAMITGAVAYLNNNPAATSVNFKALSGWVTLDKATMLAIGIAVGEHIQACFSAEMTIDADINAGKITTPAAIDADTRWPTSA